MGKEDQAVEKEGYKWLPIGNWPATSRARERARSLSGHSSVAPALLSRISWLLNNTDMNWMRQCREKGMGGAGGQGVALGFDSIIIISYRRVLVWG